MRPVPARVPARPDVTAPLNEHLRRHWCPTTAIPAANAVPEAPGVGVLLAVESAPNHHGLPRDPTKQADHDPAIFPRDPYIRCPAGAVWYLGPLGRHGGVLADKGDGRGVPRLSHGDTVEHVSSGRSTGARFRSQLCVVAVERVDGARWKENAVNDSDLPRILCLKELCMY